MDLENSVMICGFGVSGQAAARLDKGGYLVPEVFRVGGGDDALVRVEQVVALERVVPGDVHGFRLQAQQQRLAQPGAGVLPIAGPGAAVIEHGGAQQVLLRVCRAVAQLRRGQAVLLDAVVPAAYEGYAYVPAAREQPEQQRAAYYYR